MQNNVISKHNVVLQLLNDSIEYFHDEYNHELAIINVLETENTNKFIDIMTKDSIINELQNEVERNESKLKEPGSSLTIVKTISTVDTVFINTNDSVFPIRFNDEWLDLFLNYKNDSLDLKLQLKNDYNVLFGYDHHKPYIEITNRNPYTHTETLRSYRVSIPKQHRFGIGIQSGFTYNGKVIPYIGIGISYNFWTFNL